MSRASQPQAFTGVVTADKDPTKQSEHTEGPSCHLLTEPCHTCPPAQHRESLPHFVWWIWYGQIHVSPGKTTTEISPYKQGSAAKCRQEHCPLCCGPPSCLPQPAANSHAGWHSPCMLLPKPIFPSLESSLLLSPAPGTRSSAQSHPAPAVHATAQHPPLHHLSNCIIGVEIEMQESPGFYLFLLFPPLDSTRPYFRAPTLLDQDSI